MPRRPSRPGLAPRSLRRRGAFLHPFAELHDELFVRERRLRATVVRLPRPKEEKRCQDRVRTLYRNGQGSLLRTRGPIKGPDTFFLSRQYSRTKTAGARAKIE